MSLESMLQSRKKVLVRRCSVVPHATQSVLTCWDEDVTDMSHRAKVQSTDSDDYEWDKKSCDRISK